ncbi:MAG: FKBP-type peptidyl-prolyl cis-trans isomerase [Algoriphagus sp.]|jgi:FKBP-type peptidyl-prolyl cis-trans isomerase SlyD|nr:FKBP-type peptidyl-prolyl cis-trans isomerase [Algoriphagus sp.]MCE2778312.1 FKBP-type peptidyl-prolyl cis-trans isomerase [Algoriphagus sp.]
MIATNNMVVAVSYTLMVDDGETGFRWYETVTDADPFYFLFGHHNLLPALEQVLEGKSVGDTFSVLIGFEEGYGDYDDSKRVIIPKANFKEDGKKNRDLLRVGNVIPMQDDKGNHLRGEVLKVDYMGVHLDFNSPLAGLDLQFEGKIVSIREAVPVEIEHGHVHGPDGHHHH